MTVLTDPYKVLGVPKDAQITEIRAAHRKLVLKCHPDKIQDPALKEAKQLEFQQVQQAYELLSNEIEREKYDRKAEVYEHVRERERAKAAAAARTTPSTPKESPLYYNINVKDASPRSNTFSKSSPYGRTPPRSWEDTTARVFEEARRHARKTASYEREKPSKRDEDRRSRRKEEEERARERELREMREAREAREAKEARKARERKEEKERERERIARETEKEKRREEKKAHSDREKERGKTRKTETAEKHRTRHAVVEEDSESSLDSEEDDVVYEPPPKTERKKSSSGRRPDDMPEHVPTSDRTRKLSGNIEGAIQYLTKSGANVPNTFASRPKTVPERTMSYVSPMVPVPTPPPAAAGPFTPPSAPPVPQVEEPEEMSEEDDIRRSSARPTRRMSHDTPRSSREKASGHKKSSSSRDHQPIIVEAGSPPIRTVPSLSRAHTDGYSRSIPTPLARADTWYSTTERERERHERSRSRPSPPYVVEDSDDDRERHHRRSRRNKSPEPMPSQMRYTVDSTGSKSIPIRSKAYHEAPRGSYKTKGAYVMPNSSARIQRAHTTYATRDYYGDRPQHYPTSGVKYATTFNERDIAYSDLPYGGTSYKPDVYAS
ncbi:hypothetical protein F5Y10DRAFT_270502 [Nemania abortiva]|nr:hypothetical protein F5Y10DRAFT_270502 [Nemania abortiva]